MFELIIGDATKHNHGLPAPARDDVRVADLMTRPQPIVPSHISMAAARKIAQLKSADGLMVEDGGSLVGFLDGRVLAAAQPERRVADCLQPIPFCLSPKTTLARARELLIQHGVPSFPVAAGPFLLGSISRSAVERSLASKIAPTVSMRAAA